MLFRSGDERLLEDECVEWMEWIECAEWTERIEFMLRRRGRECERRGFEEMSMTPYISVLELELLAGCVSGCDEAEDVRRWVLSPFEVPGLELDALMTYRNRLRGLLLFSAPCFLSIRLPAPPRPVECYVLNQRII